MKSHLLLTTIAAMLLVGCGLGRNLEGALRSAAIDGNIEAVKRHLAAGANVNAPNTYGWTALYFASSEGHKEIVELLIANGAHVNPRADIGDTPLDGAIEDNHTEIADILRKHGGKSGVEHSIRVAAGATGRKGNIEAVKQYLAAGTDVDARDAEDKTPLQHADVNAKDDGGLTPLHFAAREGGHKEIDYKDICINLAIDPDEEIVLDEPAEDLTCLSVFDLLNGRLMELA